MRRPAGDSERLQRLRWCLTSGLTKIGRGPGQSIVSCALALSRLSWHVLILSLDFRFYLINRLFSFLLRLGARGLRRGGPRVDIASLLLDLTGLVDALL